MLLTVVLRMGGPVTSLHSSQSSSVTAARFIQNLAEVGNDFTDDEYLIDSVDTDNVDADDSDSNSSRGDSFSDSGSRGSTALTHPDPNLVEELFQKLLCYGDLRHLWPQVVKLSGPKAKIVLKRLLRRFGEDLEKEASNPRKKQASRFVRKRTLDVATRIWEAHCPDLAPGKDEVLEIEGDDQPRDIEEELDEEAANDSLDYRVIDDFIFGTSPITFLESNVREWVLLAQPREPSSYIRVFGHALRFPFKCVVAKFSHTASRDSAVLEHRCICGQVISDKYNEHRVGALEDLATQLQSYGKLAQPQQAQRSGTGITAQRAVSICTQIWSFCKNVAQGSRKATQSLPSHRPTSGTSNLYGCPRTPGPLQGTHNFLLLCLPFMRWGTKLHQAEVCRVNSDRDFFNLLRSNYQETRGRMPWSWLRRVSAIDFVRFEMFESQLVDIQLKPSIPPEDHRQDYAFELLNADTFPPIGPNLLMHYFEHPDHADVIPVLFRRIPKKLRNKLSACPIKRSSIGWGLQLAEGVDPFLLFCYGCAAFAVALTVAIIWSTLRDDVQGGFAIAGFVLAFFMFCGGVGNITPT
ncbi:hypothetical protein AAE478_003316 [Parahypoxylon ruwenzoriense]